MVDGIVKFDNLISFKENLKILHFRSLEVDFTKTYNFKIRNLNTKKLQNSCTIQYNYQANLNAYKYSLFKIEL